MALTQGHTQGSLSPEGTVSALLAFIRYSYVCAVSRMFDLTFVFFSRLSGRLGSKMFSSHGKSHIALGHVRVTVLLLAVHNTHP